MIDKVQVWIHGRTGDEKDNVLLLLTLPERQEFWQPVTGSVEPGEKIDEAALREAREETGLDFREPPRRLDYDFYFENARGRVHEHVFDLSVTPEQVGSRVRLDPHEHQTFRWMSAEDAFVLLKFESNAEALRLLLKRWKTPR